MPDSYDLERIKRVLIDATPGGDKFSRRSLSKAAGEHRDCVGDIINGRNKNPSIKVLANLADALGGDLSLFGLSADERLDPPTEDELREALTAVLPGLPRGSTDRRAQYLAEAVASVLRLPVSRRATVGADHPPAGAREEASPPRAATN